MTLCPKAFLLALVVAMLAGCPQTSRQASSETPAPPGADTKAPDEPGIAVDSIRMPIQTRPLIRHALALETASIATIQPLPDAMAELGFKTGGRIATLDAHEGDRVQSGQLLGTLAESALAASQLDVAKNNLQRDRQLFDQGIIARRQLEASKLQDQEGEQQLRATQLFAPLSGVIVKQVHTVGEYVDPSTPVLSILDLNSVNAVASVYENDIARFHLGQTVAVTVAAYPVRRFAGRVAWVSDVLDAASRSFQVKVRVANHDHALKIGMSGHVLAKQGERDVLAVPTNALLDTAGGGKQLFVREGDRYEVRPVTVGISSGEFTEIVGGVKSGELVVTQGQFELATSLNKGAAPADND